MVVVGVGEGLGTGAGSLPLPAGCSPCNPTPPAPVSCAPAGLCSSACWPDIVSRCENTLWPPLPSVPRGPVHSNERGLGPAASPQGKVCREGPPAIQTCPHPQTCLLESLSTQIRASGLHTPYSQPGQPSPTPNPNLIRYSIGGIGCGMQGMGCRGDMGFCSFQSWVQARRGRRAPLRHFRGPGWSHSWPAKGAVTASDPARVSTTGVGGWSGDEPALQRGLQASLPWASPVFYRDGGQGGIAGRTRGH